MIEKEELEQLALLSKLVFSEEETEELCKEFDEIIAFADTVNELSANQEEVLEEKGWEFLREDQVSVSDKQEDILKNAASVKDGQFFLPKHRG